MSVIDLSRRLPRGASVLLPKGMRIGMGRLRETTPAVIDAEMTNNLGETFYRVRYLDRKNKERFTYYDPKRDHGVLVR